ncbi:hypothetical protein [Acidovorax lacteus]|uniref:Nuclear transport factor 2 family protein n=1 Tax=Acidovorax lacteus TaxID=1924988 RepID=A0ABP8KZX5_9BURK
MKSTHRALSGSVRWLAAAAVLAAAAGCATTSANPEEHVTRLAEQRWAHLIDGRWQQAYDMLTPAYRKLHDLAEYRGTFKGGGVQWKGAKVVRSECEADKCELRLEITVLNPLGRRPGDTISTHVTEQWLKEGARWYYYEKP